MKKFMIEDGVFDIFPHLEIGIVALHGVDNRGPGKAELLKAICEDISAAGVISPYVTEYKEACLVLCHKLIKGTGNEKITHSDWDYRQA